MKEKPCIQVAAAIIIKEGQYLIARRRCGTHLCGFWEFPGGKREPGESLEECLHREISEELGIEVTPPRPFMVVQHDYPEKSVELHFFFCSVLKGTPRALGSDDFCWVKPENLRTYEFPVADRSVVESLAAMGGDGQVEPVKSEGTDLKRRS